MKIHIPYIGKKRVVIVGAGFAGLKLAKKLKNSGYQVVLIDRNNYHQFQPLFYQVATAGLEANTILFPLRKTFQKQHNIHIRVTEVLRVDTRDSTLFTAHGAMKYDYLVLATGADTNFFGQEEIRKNAVPMKTVAEAIQLRNTILQNYEDALTTENLEERNGLMSIVIAGGGPTGVEVAGALAEMKKFIFPKDYPELDFSGMQICLFEASPRLLGGLSEKASAKAKEYLDKSDVRVMVNTRVKHFDGKYAITEAGDNIRTNTFIWVAGISCRKLEGLREEVFSRGNRIIVDNYNKVSGYENIFALGDLAMMPGENWPAGHPQVAPVAIQQAVLLAANLKSLETGRTLKPFVYRNKGTMATVGRNRAIVELPSVKIQGFIAWLIWMFVHLMSIVGVKNRLLIFINWMWSYFTYDQSLRLILRVGDNDKTKKN
jgi:NADH:ubiquinone reductase (H+-translocating)